MGFLGALLYGRADELAFTLLVGAEPHGAGSTVRVELTALNPGAHDVSFATAKALAGTFAVTGRSVPVTLTSVEASPVAVPALGFAVRRYELILPADLVGEGILTVEATPGRTLRAVLVVVPVEPTVAGRSAAATPPLARLASAVPASAALTRNFSGRFQPNQPIYFLYGDSDQAAKFQFSFDYRLATLGGDATGAAVDTVRLGYTQRSLWDIDGLSSPFYDTSYLPEIAFCRDMLMPATRSRAFTWLGWRLGVQHESNGRETAQSRSLNTLYVRPRFVLGTLGEWAFVMLPEAQLYLGDSSENPDIDDYRGYGKLRFYFGHAAGPSLQFTGWTGKGFDHATWQLDLAVPTRLRWLNLETYFYAQYFNGYGESLRDYRRRSDALRAGLSLVR